MYTTFKEQIWVPMAGYYDKFITGFFLSNLLMSKGGAGPDSNYVSKVFVAHSHEITDRYYSTRRIMEEPSFTSFLSDNLIRLLGGNIIDRLITAYGAFPTMKAKFAGPSSFSHVFTNITNEGFYKGALTGIVPSALQLGLVMYPAVYTANTSKENSFVKFLTTYTLLDFLLYPLDTVKTILYSDLHRSYNLVSVLRNIPYTSLYRGMMEKLLFNVPLLSGIYFTAKAQDQLSFFAWAMVFLLYPLNVARIRSQVTAADLLASESLVMMRVAPYRGAVAFIFMNYLLGYTMRPLFSQQKLNRIKSEVQNDHKSKLGFEIQL